MLSEAVERADGLAAAYTADRLGEEVGDADNADLLALLGVGDRVGEDHLGEPRLVDTLGGGVAHDGVGGEGSYALGSVCEHEVGSLGHGAGGIDDVVDDDDVL